MSNKKRRGKPANTDFRTAYRMPPEHAAGIAWRRLGKAAAAALGAAAAAGLGAALLGLLT